MKIKILIFVFVSMIFPEINANFSLETKYANDKTTTSKEPKFFENILDVNIFLDDIYIFSQLEYSSPPLTGMSKTNLSNALNLFYLQYFDDSIEYTFGNLYLLYGKGLSIHTYQDQNIDYDNSIYGVEIMYHINERYDFFALAGKKNIKSRVAPDEVEPSIGIDSRLVTIGTNAYFDKFSVYFLSMLYEQYYDGNDISSLAGLQGTLIGDYLSNLSILSISDQTDRFNNIEHNFGMNYFSHNYEINYERSLVYYYKILGERKNGYREYFSFYYNLKGYNIILEHKDYNVPYFYSVFSNPPIGYRETSSILSSRNVHSLNFNNELGHQLEINKTFDSGITVLFNYSFAIHHDENGLEPNVLNLYGHLYNILNNRSYINKFANYEPYRQIYLELAGWALEETFYYRFGYDFYNEYLFDKIIEATTYPMQFAYKFKEGNSITLYVEFQNKFDGQPGQDKNKHNYRYFSPSYNHYGKWSFSFFYDYEENVNEWTGIDYTININEINQLSIFYGSQKGGLVCANGSCVQQPDFDEGVKLTYRTSF